MSLLKYLKENFKLPLRFVEELILICLPFALIFIGQRNIGRKQEAGNIIVLCIGLWAVRRFYYKYLYNSTIHISMEWIGVSVYLFSRFAFSFFIIAYGIYNLKYFIFDLLCENDIWSIVGGISLILGVAIVYAFITFIFTCTVKIKILRWVSVGVSLAGGITGICWQ